MRNILIAAIALLLSAGCTSTPVASWRDLPPSDLALSDARSGTTECPQISGSYSTRLKMWGSKDGKTYSLTGSVDYLKNIHPKENRQRSPTQDHATIDKSLPRDTFMVLQENDQAFTVLSRDKGDGPLLALKFNGSGADYTCKNGWIELRPIEYSYNSEGTTRFVLRNLRVTKLIDGSLVYEQMWHTNQSTFLVYKESYASWDRAIYPMVGP